MMDLSRIEGLLPPGSLFSGRLLLEDTVDSTNTRMKLLAAQGAPAGSVLLAEEQTGGRGTHGRSFSSPRGDGLYLSALVRPRTQLADLLTLTGWVAVAVRQGIESACGAPCKIKWLNDIYLHGRKLVGILTELSPIGESGRPDWAVIGIGVNVGQSRATFQAQGLKAIAASLAAEGFPTDRETVAAAILTELEYLFRAFPQGRAEYLSQYRKHCLTVGRAVTFEEAGQVLPGTAAGVDDLFALLVDGEDGRRRRVSSGTVKMIDKY